jgi:hypothetical protein
MVLFITESQVSYMREDYASKTPKNVTLTENSG